MSGLNQGAALAGTINYRRKDTVGNFHLTAKTSLDYADVKISKWQSSETGLRVVHVDYESPILEGAFVVATEISDDDGCAHSLEHLIFHGSEAHPYTDSLYSIASRYFTATLNAFTRQNCTQYSIQTAGEYSFLKMLPIYVEHILYPCLAHNDFITEVFHVDHDGHDAGVVYSEVQGKGITSAAVMEDSFNKAFYPSGSNWRGNISGSMERLRALELATIKNYHSTYYQPQNLCLIVAGRLSTSKLIAELQSAIEPQLISRRRDIDMKGKYPFESWKRPFFDTEGSSIPNLEDKSVDVEYPSQQSKFGAVRIVFPHPSRPDAVIETALQILVEYLTGDSGAPLRRKFMTTPSIYCTAMYASLITKAKLLESHFLMEDVPVKDLDIIQVKMRKVFMRIAKKGFDMKRMAAIINGHELAFKLNLEEQMGLLAVESFIEDFLYGDGTETQLKEHCDVPNIYASIRTWTSAKWVEILTEYFINTKMVVVRGRPSPSLSSQLETEERNRVAERVARLGKEGLEQQKLIVEAAQNNKDPIPNAILAAIPVPDPNTISWINVQSVSTKAGSETLEVVENGSSILAVHIRTDRCSLPFSLHFDHVSSFIYLNVYISLANLPHELRPIVYLYNHWFFSHNIRLEDKSLLTVEQMRPQLNQDTVSQSFGSSNDFPDHLQLSIKVEPSKYAKGVRWIYLLLFSRKFSRAWMQSGVAGLKQSVPRTFRDASGILNELYFQEMNDDTYSFKSYLSSELVKWAPELEDTLKRRPKVTMKKLKQFEDIVLNQSGLRFSVIGNILAIPSPRKPWADHLGGIKNNPLPSLRLNSASLTQLGKAPTMKAIIVSLANVHTSCSTHVALGITGWDHPLEPALIIATEILHGPEHYFYKRLRGAGIAYSFSVYVDTGRGHIIFGISKSPNTAKAYTEAKAVVQGLVDGTIPLDDHKIEAAKNSLTFNLAKAYSVPFDMANAVFMNRTLKDRPRNWNETRLSAIQSVTKEEVLAVMRGYILPLFQPETSVTLAVCGPAQTKEVVAGFKKEGFEVELRKVDDRMPWDLEEMEKGEKRTKNKAKLKGEDINTSREEEEGEKEKDTSLVSNTMEKLKNLSIGRGHGHSIFPFRKGTKNKAIQEQQSPRI